MDDFRSSVLFGGNHPLLESALYPCSENRWGPNFLHPQDCILSEMALILSAVSTHPMFPWGSDLNYLLQSHRCLLVQQSVSISVERSKRIDTWLQRHVPIEKCSPLSGPKRNLWLYMFGNGHCVAPNSKLLIHITPRDYSISPARLPTGLYGRTDTWGATMGNIG